MKIDCCHSLTSIVRGQLPPSLKRLEIGHCKNFQYVLDNTDNIFVAASSSSTSSEINKENINSTSLSHLQYFFISRCPSLTCLSSRGQLPEMLQHFKIECCQKLKSITERFHGNMSLRDIWIKHCENLRSILEGLHDLNHLGKITIFNCPNLVSFAKEDLLNNWLRATVRGCEKLEALPSHLHTLNSLRHFEIWSSTRIVSFPKKGLPTNLISLSLFGLNINNPLIEWGLHKLTSLRDLWIDAPSDAESFPPEGIEMMLPTSLVSLGIHGHPKLKYLSSKDFQNFTSFKFLKLFHCPKLISFLERGLPSSLLDLYIHFCPLLKSIAKRIKGNSGPRSPTSLALI